MGQLPIALIILGTKFAGVMDARPRFSKTWIQAKN